MGALLLGAMSPGPSFVLVARASAARGRREGASVAVGMGLAGVLFAALALVGLVALWDEFAWVSRLLRIAGGAYLLVLSVRLLRGSDSPVGAAGPQAATRSMLSGAATQLSNPKTLIVYAGVFAALLPADPSWQLAAAVLAGVLVVEAGWYTLVAFVFSSPGPRRTYLAASRWVDRVAGAVLGVLGMRLVLSAR